MSSTIALITDDQALVSLARLHFSVQGLSVIVHAKLPKRAPRVLVAVVDESLVDADRARRFAVQSRSIGSDVVLCGHWSRAERLQRIASQVRLPAIEYPVDPFHFRQYFSVNPISVRSHPYERLRRFSDLAGRLYEHEGVVADKLDLLVAAIMGRMERLEMAKLADYHRRAAASSAELSRLAAQVDRSKASLFQPANLLAAFEAHMVPTLSADSTLLVLGANARLFAFSVTMLRRGLGHGAAPLVLCSKEDDPFSRALTRGQLLRTPQVYRTLARSWIRDVSTSEARIAESLVVDMRAESLSALSAASFDGILNLDGSSGAKIEELASLLRPGGRLLSAIPLGHCPDGFLLEEDSDCGIWQLRAAAVAKRDT